MSQFYESHGIQNRKCCCYLSRSVPAQSTRRDQLDGRGQARKGEEAAGSVSVLATPLAQRTGDFRRSQHFPAPPLAWLLVPHQPSSSSPPRLHNSVPDNTFLLNECHGGNKRTRESEGHAPLLVTYKTFPVP